MLINPINNVLTKTATETVKISLFTFETERLRTRRSNKNFGKVPLAFVVLRYSYTNKGIAFRKKRLAGEVK